MKSNEMKAMQVDSPASKYSTATKQIAVNPCIDRGTIGLVLSLNQFIFRQAR